MNKHEKSALQLLKDWYPDVCNVKRTNMFNHLMADVAIADSVRRGGDCGELIHRFGELVDHPFCTAQVLAWMGFQRFDGALKVWEGANQHFSMELVQLAESKLLARLTSKQDGEVIWQNMTLAELEDCLLYGDMEEFGD